MKLLILLALQLVVTPFFFSQHAVEIKSINPDSTDFSDLVFLRKDLENVQIVGLGEQLHFGGATFDAKVRMIKFLHETLGYNVIVFESGLYDCTKAYELIKERQYGNDTNYLNKAIFGVWNNEEVHKLAAYIDETQMTENPLILSGFDCQFAGILAKDYFVKDFNQVVDYLDKTRGKISNIDTSKLNNSLRHFVKYSNYFKKLDPSDTSILSSTIDTLITIIDNDKIETEYISYWRQIFKSIKVDYRKPYLYETKKGLRDSLMAENVEWLLNEKFKGQKIILWAANTHLANSTTSVKEGYLSKNLMMGFHLKNTFGDKYFPIGFTSYEGKFHTSWLISYLVKEKPEKFSIENFLYKKGYEFSFLNIRNQQEKNDPYFMNSKIFGNSKREMNLYEVMDGIFYIREMYPATYPAIK